MTTTERRRNTATIASLATALGLVIGLAVVSILPILHTAH